MANKDTNKKSNFSKFMEIFKIRMQLLWIWFLKNLSVILKTVLAVVIVLIVINVIDGSVFLSIFGMSKADIEQIDWHSVKSIENAIASVISIGFSVFIFLKKTKHIAIEDIKSRELKIALIKARLYFNENGKLCKRLEETTQIDIDGDNKIGDQNIENVKSENLITGIPRAIGELATVMTVKIDVEEEEKVVESAELNEELPAVENISTEEKLYTEDAGAPVIVNTTSEDDDEFIAEEEKVEQKLAENRSEVRREKRRERKEAKKNKKRNPVSKFFIDLFVAIRDAFKDPELNDGMDAKKKKKHNFDKYKHEIEEEEQDNNSVEIVEDNEESTVEYTGITTSEEIESKEDIEVINSSDHKENEEKPIENKTPIKQEQPKMSVQAKKINDVLNSLK